MTQDEANKIAAVIRTADGGCGVCVGELCKRLNAAGLGFTWDSGRSETVIEQPEWSDDPEDAIERDYPVVTATTA